MKRFFSWFVLFIEYLLLSVIISLFLWLIVCIFDAINNFNIIIRLLIYIAFGSSLVGLLIAPFMYLPMLLIAGSNAISPSRTGRRFRVFFSISLIYEFLSFIIYFYNKDLAPGIHSVIMCILSLIILSASKAENFLDE
jgi:hypothetical protein